MGSPIAYQEIYKASMEDFVVPVYEVAPFTTIQNRAMVTRSLKAIAGVERIHVKGINQLRNEFGPNGERVFEADNKDARIRFVGNITQNTGADGSYINIPQNAFAEITFYGTGLNFFGYLSTSVFDLRSTVDGGVESVTTVNPVGSSVLSGRGYGPNTVLPVISGLTLGWHTVRLRNNAATTPLTYGFEILNQRTDLAVFSGQGISQGSSQGLSALTTSAFNAGVVGTRGARVVKYIQGGVVSQAVQEVDATSKYLTLADHTNEEVLRRVNFREFGANRADDFSTITGVASNRAFTLDDGTTTLVVNNWLLNNGPSAPDGIISNGSTALTITFVGTGLDVIRSDNQNGTSQVNALTVDGVSQGNLNATSAVAPRLERICSGLPYGTHTVRMASLSVYSLGFIDFIIYQPKKPVLPAGAVEVADYNEVADYVGISSFATLESISQGIIRKMGMREVAYVGTWIAPALNQGFVSGWNVSTITTASYMEYNFYGTGIDIITRFANAAVYNSTIRIDGSNVLSGFTTALITSTTGVTLTAATGLIAGTATGSFQANVRITGLSLGWHTVRWTTNNTATNYLDAIDIITPIHSQEASLKVGSTSLKSVTKYSPEKSVSNAGPDLGKAKAYLFFDGANSKILNSLNISAVVNISAGAWIVYFEKPFKNENFIIAGMSEFPEIQYDRTPSTAVSGSNRVHIYTSNSAGAYSSTSFCFVCYGELIDDL